MTDRPPLRAQARALALLLVIALHAWVALPLKRPLSSRTLEEEQAREELTRWSERLAGIGVERSPDQLRDEVLEVTGVIGGFRKRTLEPTRPLLKLTGTGQSWGLFTYPNTRPHQLQVELWQDEAWVPIYIANDPELDWREAWFKNRRIRGVFDDSSWREARSYQHFCRLVSTWAFTDHPEVDRIRISMIRSRVKPPGEPPDPTQDRRLIRLCERTDGDPICKEPS